jgi:hypothetical protein
MNFTRVEQMGKVVFLRGSERLAVPSDEALRERLTKLLEEVHGDTSHAKVTQFFNERVRDMGNSDEMKAAWADDVFKRLDAIWSDLTTPPVVAEEVDPFAGFGD